MIDACKKKWEAALYIAVLHIMTAFEVVNSHNYEILRAISIILHNTHTQCICAALVSTRLITGTACVVFHCIKRNWVQMFPQKCAIFP